MTTLTLQQAVRNAIEAERCAAEFYETMARRANDVPTRHFFEDMVRVEAAHGGEIEKLGRKLLDGSIPERADSDVSVIETAPEWLKAEEVDIDEAFEVALECESRAALFYDAIADQFPGEGARFFRSLARAEEQHARTLGRALHDLRNPDKARLTLGQAVRNAISAERASAAFYRVLATRVSNPSAKKFFLELVGVEHLHATEIENVSRSLLHGPLAHRANIQVESVETAPWWTFDDNVDVVGAMYVALEAELHAARYYAMVASQLQGEEAEFFHSLARTEQDHAELIRAALAKTAIAAA